MSHSNSEKLVTIYKLLSEYNFEINENVNEDLKCVLCKKILINACQGPCGCSFCQKCIEEYLINGGKVCPGKSDECKDQTLSDIQIDYKANKNIANLIVKCPEKTCQYKNKLIHMSNHLQLCSKKSVKCPFYDLGCDEDELASDKIIDHIQSESYNHNSMILNINNQLKHKIEILKYNEEIHENHIKTLEENLKEKDSQIEAIKREIVSLTNKLNEKIDQNSFRMNTIFIEMAKDFDQKLKQAIFSVNEKNDKYKREITSRINKSEKHENENIDKIAGSIIWNIAKISQIRKKGSSVESEYFYTGYNKYKIRLLLYANGTGDVTGTGLSIYLYIYPCSKTADVDWPFKGEVTIKILNKLNPNANAYQSKYCIIDKFEGSIEDESDDSYLDESIDSCNYNWDNQFDFLYSDLTILGILDDNILTVECYVKIK